MTRTRASAKKAGSAFETLITTYLRRHLADERIERRARNGAIDRGDVTGLLHMGQRLVLEAKSCARVEVVPWLKEAEVERCNDSAGVGMVVFKRRGSAKPGEQVVLMTLADLVSLISGSRPDEAAGP